MLQIEYFLLLSFYFMHTSGVDRAVHVVCSIVQIAVDRLSLESWKDFVILLIWNYQQFLNMGKTSMSLSLQ